MADSGTAFAMAWETVVAGFRTADELGASIVSDVDRLDYDAAIAKIRRIEKLAADVATNWLTSRHERWSSLDEPLSAYAAAYVDEARRGRADLANAKAGIMPALRDREPDTLAATLTEAARTVCVSLGGERAQICAIGIGG